MLSFVVLLIGAFRAAAAAELYDAKVVFHHNSEHDTYELLQADKVFGNSNFDKTRQTVLYSHGYFDKIDGDHVMLLVNAYKNTDSFNILLFDWRELASAFYTKSMRDITKLAEELAKFIIKGTEQGYAINKWHLVGHSLGAHLSGLVGKRVKTLSNNSLVLPRISGLDPAGPGFYGLFIAPHRISKSDADFVDIIHTDAGGSGGDLSTGTVDFWPNNGRRFQPGCSVFQELFGCSHSRAFYLWLESVESRGKNTFAVKSEHTSRTRIRMGIDCPVDAQPGTYILSTNDRSPYSLS